MSTYLQRAARIVDRVLPVKPTPHGFYDPDGFVLSARYRRERKMLLYRTFARLRAKAEGGKPCIIISPADAHLWRPGDAIYDVSKELEAAA